MRRAILQGRRIGIEERGFLTQYADVVRDTMGTAYPELIEHRASVDRWLASEEEGFGRTIEQGTKLLDEMIARAKDAGAEGIGADNAFLLHDTYGFPIDLTLELAAEQDLGVDEPGFETLMDEQRTRSRKVGGAAAKDDAREQIRSFADGAGFETSFTGYETTEQTTQVGAVSSDNGRVLVKLVESPFYPAGGGQVSDTGVIECEHGDCRARVTEVVRIGDDQALVLELIEGELQPEERVVARVDPAARRPTECNHTATHLLHARAARATRRPRAPGGLLRRSRQAALRLHARIRPEPGRAGRGRGPRQRDDPRQQPRPRDHDDARRGARARRDGAVRREVRRRRAHGRGRRYPTDLVGGQVAPCRASCAVARTCASTAEIGVLKILSEVLERRERQAHRGAHGSGGDRAAAPSRQHAHSHRGGPEGAARSRGRGRGGISRQAQGAREGCR